MQYCTSISRLGGMAWAPESLRSITHADAELSGQAVVDIQITRTLPPAECLACTIMAIIRICSQTAPTHAEEPPLRFQRISFISSSSRLLSLKLIRTPAFMMAIITHCISTPVLSGFSCFLKLRSPSSSSRFPMLTGSDTTGAIRFSLSASNNFVLLALTSSL